MSCKEAFYKIFLFYNNPDDLYELSDDEFNKLENIQHHMLYSGENFDPWTLAVILARDVCSFIWVHCPNGDKDTFEVRNNIQCAKATLDDVKQAYRQLCGMIPDVYWPTEISKLE